MSRILALMSLGVTAAWGLAGDDVVKLGRFQPSAGGFGGAVATAADADKSTSASDDDTELVCHRRRHCCYSCYRPAYVTYYVPAPVCYAPPVYRVPTYAIPPAVGFGAYSAGYATYAPISSSTATPLVMNLPTRTSPAAPVYARTEPAPRPQLQPVAVPAPAPKADPRDDVETFKISLPGKNEPTPTATPKYKYAAYGEKK